jgi:HEPN domain-containing protein
MIDKEEAFLELLSNKRKRIDENIVNYILTIIQIYSDLKYDYYFKKSRKVELVKARHLAMYFAKEYTETSLKKLGRKFNKDHSTIIHGINRIKNGIKYEPDVSKDVKNIKKIIHTRISAMLGDVDIEEQYYYIDLNSIYSIKIDNTKSIILNGFNEEEANAFIQSFKNVKEELKEHQNTGIYILEKRKENGSK